jgi:hypothetical protein
MAQTLEHLADHCHGNNHRSGIELTCAQKASRFGIDTPASSRRRAAK